MLLFLFYICLILYNLCHFFLDLILIVSQSINIMIEVVFHEKDVIFDRLVFIE